MIFVNFKTYPKGTGEEAEEMVKICHQVQRVFGVPIVPVVQALDLYRVSKDDWDYVWCQHADGVEYGSNTGWILPEGVKQNGGAGVMLNHAEHKFRDVRRETGDGNNTENTNTLAKAVERCRAVGLKVGICADGLEEVREVVQFNPDWVAYEPPELIGSEEVSVSSAKPDVVREAVIACGEVPLLIGAGVRTVEDIKIGLQLGAKGFLIASAVMKADNPDGVLRELVAGYEG